MTKKTPNIASFVSGLEKLMKKHDCYLIGDFKITHSNIINTDTLVCTTAEYIHCGGIKNNMGPFIVINADRIEKKSNFDSKKVNITVLMKDKLLENGVLSPIDGKAFHNRADWADHLKRHDCVEFGNDLNNAKQREEVRGDFDCRKELGEATHRVMEKYGH